MMNAVNTVRFGNVAHIIAPKQAVGFALALESQLAGVAQKQSWQKPFPFDDRYSEAVLLTGKDLKEAGDTSGWDFERALAHLQTRIKTKNTTPSKAFFGTEVTTGYTHTNGRVALYSHAPQLYVNA